MILATCPADILNPVHLNLTHTLRLFRTAPYSNIETKQIGEVDVSSLANSEGRRELSGEHLMATASTLETRETTSLIGSDKVDGTAVYGVDQQKIGSIERVMIDKTSRLCGT